MDKQTLKDIKPVIDFVYGLMEEIEEKEHDFEKVRSIARQQNEKANELNLRVNELKKDNYNLQMVIEEHCTEEEKKLIFK